MGLIKYFNQSTLSWEIVAGSDATNISLHNEFLLDDKNAAISTARAFQKINNKISQLEHHLAWVYLNGAKGGSGGGGGGTGGFYTITINNGKDVFYTSTNSITINMTINSGTTRKTFYVNAINMATGKMLVDGESHSSMVPFDFTIPNLPSSTNYIYLQAYDSLDNYTELVEIVVNVGSLSIVQSGRPGAIYTIGNNNNTIASFQVLNKTGNAAYLLTYKSRSSDPLASALESGGNVVNGFRADYITTINNNNLASVYIVDFNNDLAETSAGKVVTYKTVLYSHELGYLSGYFTNQITVSTGNSLSAVLYGLAEVPEDAGDYLFELNNYCNFDILLYYEKVDVRTFYYRYKVYKGEELFYESQVNSMLAATSGSTSINCPTQNFAVGNDYSLVFEACATDDFDLSVNPNLYSTVTGYFAVKQGQTGILQDYKGALLARFGSFNFPGGKQTRWTYNIAQSGDYYFTSWPVSTGYDSTSMNIHNATADTGLITNVSRYVNLQGNTYATIDEFSKLFPQSTNLNASLFGTGFYIQVTYEYLSDNPIDQTILSFGEYQNGELYRGFEINSDYIKVAFGTVSGVQVDTPVKAENAFGAGSVKKTKTTTIGLNVWSTTIKTTNNTELNTYYFALYIDGVMTKCALIPQSVLTNVSTGWMFASPLYLGCRNDLSNQANCNIYDFKLYAQNQPDLSIVHNYISATEQAHLILSSTGQPTVDDQLDTILRNKNLFVKGGNTCLLCDTSSGEYLDPATMYSRIASSYSDSASGYDLDYPIIYIEEVGTTSDMYQCVKATWDTQATVGGIRITKKNWPVKITITTKYGTTVVQSDDVSLQPTVAIQGTSSLSYNSKNLEIIMGQVSEGIPKLLKINDWLPENEFTLKADVVDSAHVNNVAIGNFVNNTEYIEHYAGSGYSSDNIGRRIKKTSEGFPCLVFVKYSDGSVDEGTNITRDTDGTILSKIGKTEFMGVYNFNLGRYAYFNLGLKKLESFSQDSDKSDFAPQVITEYTYSEPSGIYSMEVGDNFGNTEELFTQADKTISEYITECRYTPTSEDDAYDAITNTLFTTLALSDPTITFNRKRRTTTGAYEDILDSNGNPLKWASDSNLSDEVTIDLNLDLTEARKYLILALVFGLVDSVCKNMVFRTWDATRWVLAFYDMDTAFKKDNRGASSVRYDAHYNYFFNVEGIYSDAMNSYTEGVRLFPRSVPEDPNWKYTYAGMCSSAGVPNRIWNVIQQCDTRKINSGDLASTLPGLYWLLRNNYIIDPDTFIDNYFSNYINKTGAIMYNYDYRQKYVSYSQVWLEGVGLVADTSASQTEFLDGTRISQVRAWFKKRINFLDSVYSSFRQGDTSSNSYMKDTWNAGQVSSDTVTAVTIIADQKCKIGYAVSSGDVRYIWVDETPRSYNLQTQTQGNLFYLYGNTIIKLFPGFNKLGWTNFTSAFNFKLLQELNMTGLEVSSFTEANNLNGMPNLRVLNLTDFKYNGDNSITIGLTNNTSIQEVYLRGECNIPSFLLPSSGTLKVLDLTDNVHISSIPTQTVSGVTQSCLIDQSGLETLLLKGTSISNLFGLNQGLINLPSLKNLTLPSSLEKLTIQNCGLENFLLTWDSSRNISPLTHVQITDCEQLKSIDLSGQNNLEEISIYNCPNLEKIILSNIVCKNIQLDLTRLTKLKILMINGTSLFTNLDLTNSPDLNELYCYQCTNLESVKCVYNEENPIELPMNAFRECSSLKNLEGYFQLQGRSIFFGCSELPFDDLIYLNKLKITFSNTVSDFSQTFYECKLLGLKYDYPIELIQSLPLSTSNISEMFKSTSSSFIMTPDMFCRVVNGEMLNLNVTNISGIFESTNISGNFYSEYTTEDGEIHGFFAHMPYILNCESAFTWSGAERYIDNNFFHFSKAEQLVNVDSMFSFNFSLKAVNDTTGRFERVEEPLHSKDFFIRLTNCVHPENRMSESQSVPNPDWMYPRNVFNGSEVEMIVDLNDQGHPFLFHVPKESYRSKKIYTEGLLYKGLHLILDYHNCDYSYLFGGNSNELGYKSISDGTNTYYIPLFVKISKPFYPSDELYLDLNDIDGEIFFDKNTQYLISPFYGMNVLLTDTIPDNLFKGASNVQSLEGFFSDLNLNNLDGDVYDFNEHDLFKWCTSLTSIDSIFKGCQNFRMRLAPEMFKNCKLTNVSCAFEGSRVIEKLPNRLFYMVNDSGVVLRTIQKMTNIFNRCYNLGYSADYTYKLVATDLNENLTTWDNHIVETGTFLGDNYTIPQDLFWYCTKNPAIDYVLGQMFWKETSVVLSYDINHVIDLDNYIGPQCTIPSKLLSNPETQIYLSDKLNYVFANTHFKPSGTLGSQDSSGVYARGNLYPDDLFSGMSNLSDIQGMFYGTIIDKNCMINENLFVYNLYDNGGTIVKEYLPLKNISSVWLDCTFTYLVTMDETGHYQADEVGHPQINFEMFDPLNTLTNVGYLFAATGDNNCGLRILSDKLFRGLNFEGQTIKTLNISGMFMYSHLAVDSCPAPLFTSVRRNLAAGYDTYLSGLTEDLISNSEAVRNAGLYPPDWDY